LIKFNNVSKTYKNSVKALSNVGFEVKKGEIVGVIGRNGAGKSTMFKIMCGLIEDYEGESFVSGKKSSIDLAETISYLPEVRGIDQRKYIQDHLIDLVMYKGISKKNAQKEVEKWLKEFGLYERRYSKISSLSKGNQQRIQLIAALASKPELLILDEPFSGLDLITVDFFWKILLRLRDEGCTIIFSTHDLNDDLLYCDKFLFIDHGCMKQFGTLDEIQNNFPFVLELDNASANEEHIRKIAGNENVTRRRNEYYIKLKEKSMSRRIFDDLAEPYSEKFYLRKMNISEIFRELSGGN